MASKKILCRILLFGHQTNWIKNWTVLPETATISSVLIINYNLGKISKKKYIVNHFTNHNETENQEIQVQHFWYRLKSLANQNIHCRNQIPVPRTIGSGLLEWQHPEVNE